MENVYFFQIRKIPKDTIVSDQLKEQGIFFSYFKVDQKYYLLLYDKQLFKIDFLIATVNFIKQLNVKKRKIRSLRGFLLYAIEIMENGRACKILFTNLSPLFWEEVKDIIRQNRKRALDRFLFQSEPNQLIENLGPQNNLKEQIKSLENKIDSLQDKINYLERVININYLETTINSASSNTMKDLN